MDRKNVSNDVLKEYLFKLTQNFLTAIQNKDADTVKNLAENEFASQLVAKMDGKSHGFQFSPYPIDMEKVQIVDKLLIRGMGVDRSTNDSNMDYVRVTKFEKRGLRQYVHKYNLGLQDFYF